MAVLTAEEVTNLYLYGSKTVPSDLTAESLIRELDESEITKEYVDINEYMADIGRFASPASFGFKRLFK
jgi:glutaredoxin-related protein